MFEVSFRRTLLASGSLGRFSGQGCCKCLSNGVSCAKRGENIFLTPITNYQNKSMSKKIRKDSISTSSPILESRMVLPLLHYKPRSCSYISTLRLNNLKSHFYKTTSDIKQIWTWLWTLIAYFSAFFSSIFPLIFPLSPISLNPVSDC